MADKGEGTSVDPKPTQGKKTQPRGLQLLPILLKYFKTVGLLLGIWSVGYFKFSPSWVMMALAFYMFNEEYRKVKDAKKAFAMQAVLDEKGAILARTDELPSWVYFPDVERAEWLNKMIKQMWPYIGEYAKNLLKTSVEPSVQNSLPNSLKPFKFEYIDLGDIPPRIGGVKVYIENVKRDEIFLDMELFYASDSNIKVAVRGLTAGIKDLTIHGTLRLVMKPLCNQIPIIGGMNVFFLNKPSIDFDMTNTANILDMPLLSNTLRSVVADQVAYYLVLPNKIPIQLVKDIDMTKLQYPMPSGVLRLHLVAARELKAADVKLIGKGKSDPYVKLYVGAQTFKTKVKSDTVNPVWNAYFEAVVDQKHGQFAEFEVLDEDPGEDDELGTASIDIQNVAENGTMDSWLPLENVSTGMLHVRALWLHLSKNPDDLEKEDQQRHRRSVRGGRGAMEAGKKASIEATEEQLSSALLLVYLDSAKDLPRSKKSMSEPSPYARLAVGNEERKSVSKHKTTDPKWEENFQFLIHDPRHQELYVEIVDSAKEKKKKLGCLSVSLKSILTAQDMILSQPFTLKESGATSKITLRVCLRVLSSEVPPDWAIDSVHTPTATPTEAPAEQPPLQPRTQPAEKPPQERGIDVGDDNPPAHDFVVGSRDPDTVSNDSSNFERPVASSELRSRVVSSMSQSSDVGLGRIQVTIRYSTQRSRLIVVVHKAMNLMACDDDNYSDPYVRIYLLPDKSSSSKRKTQTVKNDLNPVFDETFEWTVSLSDAQTRTLDLTVKNSVGMFSKSRTHIGQIFLDLSTYDLTTAMTEWYDLQDPESERSKDA